MMKVAFATQDNRHINAHFGWAKKIDIYDVFAEGYEFLYSVEFGGELKEDGNEDKLIPKISTVRGCQIVYVSEIGCSAASRLLQHNVAAIKAENQGDQIIDVLNILVETFDSPPPSLRKVLGKRSPSFNFDDEQF